MKNSIKPVKSNITFIGSGISASFTLLHFIDNLEKRNTEENVEITIIDKYPEFHSGIPYGTRSGVSVLLITSLKNFLPEPELGKFIIWINTNKEWLLKEFSNEGGKLSQDWLAKHAKEIEHNEWEDIFIPRRFFGYYIDEKLKQKIAGHEAKNLIKVNYIIAKVIDLEKFNDSWKIILDNNSIVFSEKVILSIGSLPTNYLWKNKRLIKKDNFLFINNPYKPELQKTLKTIRTFIKKQNKKEVNTVIVGANASGLELLYKINDDNWLGERIGEYTILSTQGLLPDSRINKEKLSTYTPSTLKALKNNSSLTAKKIAEAAFLDLEKAEKIDLGAASTVGVISSAFGSLLSKLNKEELKNFACHYGNEIGRKQRCAGDHYSNTVKKLELENRFNHIAGRFSDITHNDSVYHLEYLDTKTKQNKTLEKPVHIVINCVGSMNLTANRLPLLLKNLIEKGYLASNKSKIGFEVNNQFEASPNLYVIGPLLAGNVIDDHAVWHVEHCGRIIWLSKMLANILHNPTTTTKDLTYTFKVKNLNQENEIISYKNTIKAQWKNTPYYTYEYISHLKNDESELIVFELKKGDKSLIIMPMVKRSIPGTKNNYYDVISPYGYSGPLYKENTDSLIITEFWNKTDEWYSKNNVVTEFVRFSLTDNHANYTGICMNSLKNVCGQLMPDFNMQWDSFASKVRNNYRKADKNDLQFKIFEHTDISIHEIKLFYEIYLSTMKRNNAQDFLFFSLDFFTNLILNNSEKFSLAFAYCKDLPISTELIINHEDFIHAYLGGTYSDYYTLRPNDFLRVEIIKWGIHKNKKIYILGGGVQDNDGLYRSKKSLFPKDEDLNFITGRKVVNKEVYDRLNNHPIIEKNNEEKSTFFPLYRCSH